MDTLKIAEPLNPLAFILNNNILSENGSPIEFKDHYFLIDPYADMSPEQVVMKPSQIGWSTLGINKALWLAKFKKANLVYTLPSKSVVKDFVSPKVDPIIMQNPIYQSWLGKTDSIALKAVGDRFIYFRGSWEIISAISISAHILINDEKDRSNQKVLSTYQTRLDDAKRERPDLGLIWQWSNPSIPGYGVDETWQRSDQKHWFIKCPHCNSEFYLKFPENINFQTEQYICTNCQKTLTDNDRRNGRWVKKFTNRDISGYWISQLMVPWISAKDIIKKSKGDKSIFHNFCLGLPYISADESVSRKTITDCIIPTTNPRTHVCIGVDNGVVKTVVIGNIHGIFKIYETESWEDIEADLIRYNATMVIDANPYPTRPKQLVAKYPGRVFAHYFVQEQKDLQIIKWGEGDKDGVVVSDRTKIIDMVVSELKNQEIIFNLTLTELEQYIYDWTQLYRTIEENAQGIQKPVWRTIEDRRDHYCFIAGTKISTIKGQKNIENIKVGELVLTRKGYMKVVDSFLEIPDAEVITAILTNGIKITGTSDHKIWTKNKGWVELQRLTYYDILDNRLWWKELYFKVAHIVGIQTLNEETIGFIFNVVAELKNIGIYISQFGKVLMGRYQKGLQFITKTTILSIIAPKILSVLRGGNISPTMYLKNLKMKNIERGIKNIWQSFGKRGFGGIKQKRVKNSIKSKQNIFIKKDNLFVQFVKKNMLHKLWGGINTAQLDAVLRFIIKSTIRLLDNVLFVIQNFKRIVTGVGLPARQSVRVKEFLYPKQKQAVYNLTIENQHEYYANGILVSNCFAQVYWRIALEKVFVFGGVIKTPSKKKSSFIKESVAVAPDGTIPAIDVKEVLQRSIKGKKDWKLK